MDVVPKMAALCSDLFNPSQAAVFTHTVQHRLLIILEPYFLLPVGHLAIYKEINRSLQSAFEAFYLPEEHN